MSAKSTQRISSITAAFLLGILGAQEAFAQPLLSKSDIKPCEAILAKSLPIELEYLKSQLQRNLDRGDELRVGWFQGYIDKLNGPEPLLAFALLYYTPYDLNKTKSLIKEDERQLAILRSGDEREMVKVWGITYRGQKLANKIIETEKSLCLMNVRLTQLQVEPAPALS